jgi:hypothetical protein
MMLKIRVAVLLRREAGWPSVLVILDVMAAAWVAAGQAGRVIRCRRVQLYLLRCPWKRRSIGS